MKLIERQAIRRKEVKTGEALRLDAEGADKQPDKRNQIKDRQSDDEDIDCDPLGALDKQVIFKARAGRFVLMETAVMLADLSILAPC